MHASKTASDRGCNWSELKTRIRSGGLNVILPSMCRQLEVDRSSVIACLTSELPTHPWWRGSAIDRNDGYNQTCTVSEHIRRAAALCRVTAILTSDIPSSRLREVQVRTVWLHTSKGPRLLQVRRADRCAKVSLNPHQLASNSTKTDNFLPKASTRTPSRPPSPPKPSWCALSPRPSTPPT